MNARYYLPQVGRFVSPDSIVPEPENPQSYNRYSYSFNNPINLVDPSGNTTCYPTFRGINCIDPYVIATQAVSLLVNQNLIVKNPRVEPSPSSKDVTNWLAYQLSEAPNSNAFQITQSLWNEGDVVGASFMWARYVFTDAVWDFKFDLIAQGVPDEEGNVILGEKQVNFQAIANIFFGFVGRSIGMGEGYLQFGAGIAQVENGLSKWFRNFASYPAGWGDQEFDAWSIGFGFYLYELYGDDLSQLTENSLAEAFNNYVQDNPIPELK